MLSHDIVYIINVKNRFWDLEKLIKRSERKQIYTHIQNFDINGFFLKILDDIMLGRPRPNDYELAHSQ